MSTTTNRIESNSAIVDMGFGLVRVTFHGNGVAVVSTAFAGEIQPDTHDKRRADTLLEIRGVEYRGRVDLRTAERFRDQNTNPHLVTDPLGPKYQTRGAYFGMGRSYRAGKGDRPSDSARAKLERIAVEAAALALDECFGIEEAGEALRLEGERAQIRRNIAELEKQLATKRKELEDLG